MFTRIPKELQTDKVYVLQTKYADVNGDGVLETLTLTGKKPYGENGFIEDITLTIKNEKAAADIVVKPENNDGYSPTLFIGKFTEDKVPQVLLSIASGGSGGYYFNYLYSFKDNITKSLFDVDKFNEMSTYNAVYQDYYKVKITSEDGKLKGLIDLTAIRDKDYLSNLYNPNGTLKKPEVGGVLSLGALSPLSLNGADVFYLLTNQRIIGLYNSDTLGAIESILQVTDNGFNIIVTRLVVLINE
ncbi:hypothetical protein N4T77_19615 [Clostridium sp. CX1]|uniref:hypothetical protein n=1 Tax=Clostridium sp. CX1 TaxID=2978346 RepID=UPI0021C052ED|nr:hypothetical protein [Clostridium sp. CX1]MCT8978792.1 hypothetical protein [Clostridium sp. CX1]